MKTPIERFWAKVDRKGLDECWLWRGALNGQGYGNLRLDKVYTSAHRVSWEIHNGKIPENLWVLHHCDNPPCVNPRHLFLGDVKDNNRDSVSKGRDARHEKHGMSRLRWNDVRAIRELHDLKWSGRDIASALNVSYALVSLIINRKVWVL